MSFKKSKFYEGLVPEQYSFITGINETVEEKTLIKPHTRYIMAATDYSDGISTRKLGLSTDGFGHGRLPYDGTSLYSGYGRGMGIFQLYGSATNFSTYFATIFPQAPSYPANTVNSWDQWAFSSATKTNLTTFNGPGGNPVNTQLPCHVFYNGFDILTDNQFLEGLWNIASVGTPAPLIQQGIAPTISSTPGSGVLSGFYGYCYTVIDANKNESQPSPLLATGNLASNKVILTVTPTGITQGVWTTIRIYRTLTNTVAVAASQNPTFYYVPGLDTTLTGAGSYTIPTDNTPDSTLIFPTN